jgi:hypothetical protein
VYRSNAVEPSTSDASNLTRRSRFVTGISLQAQRSLNAAREPLTGIVAERTMAGSANVARRDHLLEPLARHPGLGDPMNTATQMLVREERRATVPLPLTNLVGIAALSTVIAIHTAELGEKIEETAYLGFGYILLIAASLVSIILLAQRDRRGWMLGGLACGLTIVGYVLTRTTGLPNATGDKGNWGETIAIWSLFAEGLMVVLSVAMLTRRPR